MAGARKRTTIGTLYGLAKSPELSLDNDSLHALVYRETGKESLRQLTTAELDRVARVLGGMKDGLHRQKRTDTGGNLATVAQRHKVYVLTGLLGWNNDNRRINGFVKRMFEIDRLEWLTRPQCHDLIEMLKKYVAREGAQRLSTDSGT